MKRKANKLVRVMSIMLAAVLCVSVSAPAMAAAEDAAEPQVVFNFENGVGAWVSSIVGRGERGSLELNSVSTDGDAVRFGEHALRLNFDMTDAQFNNTDGCYYGPGSEYSSITFGNNPTKIGMWVYATPEAQGYLFRGIAYNQSGGSIILDYGPPDPESGVLSTMYYIDWVGWKYIEAPLGNITSVRLHTTQLIRLLSLSAGNPNGGGPRTKGYIVVDNISVVYGDVDTASPIVAPLSADGRTYTESGVDISAAFDDDDTSAIVSGINYESVRMTIDGVQYKDGDACFSLERDSNTISVNGLNFHDGLHCAEAYVEDNFGNIGTSTAYFTVDTGSDTTVKLVPDEEAYIGGTFELKLAATNPADVKAVTFKLQLSNNCSIDPENGIVFSESAKESGYSFDSRNGYLVVNVQNDSSAGQDTLATIKIDMPQNCGDQEVFRYSLVSSDIAYASPKANYSSTFFIRPGELKILGTYALTVNKLMVGAPGEVLVTDLEGIPQSGVQVNIIEMNGTAKAMGITDANGLVSGDIFTDTAKWFYIYAEKDGKYSATQLQQSLSPLLTSTPTFIRSGAAPDPATSKTITWMSNPLTTGEPVIIRIAEKADGEGSFEQFTGESKLIHYNGEATLANNGMAKACSVTVTGLREGTDYIYQVGDGVVWSSTQEFTTTSGADKFSFNVFGDLQATALDQMGPYNQMAASVDAMEPKSLFNIHVGDMVDNGIIYRYYQIYGDLLNNHPVYANIDMASVYGNHEYYGDDGATNMKFINGTPGNGFDPSGGSYSVDYGNIHLVVLDWAGMNGISDEDVSEVYRKQAEWLREDLKNTDKTWKIVAMHYSVYHSGVNTAVDFPMAKQILAPVFDEFGVQAVFSGHYHTYARTPQIKDGAAVQEGGTMYITCGEVRNTGNNTIYITADVDGNEMKLTVKRADNTVRDSFTLYAKANTAELEAKIAEAQALNASDYTAESFSVLSAALEAAIEVRDNYGAAQAEVDAALAGLAGAIEALVRVIQYNLDVSVSTPTIVETLEAYLNISVTGDNLDGAELKAYLRVDGELLHETPVTFSGGAWKGRMHISKAPEFGKDCSVVVRVDGGEAQGNCPITLAEYKPAELWNPSAYFTYGTGKLIVEFGGKIGPNANGYTVKSGSKTYTLRQNGDRSLMIDIAPGELEQGTNISIGGVKYPDLFPSYSFTFTVAIPAV